MAKTIIEKIIGAHAGRDVVAGDMVDIEIDARVARDFGGANVVKNLVDNGLGIADPARTFFTFDCNPGGSDQSYATNQQRCRVYARQHGIRVYDIDSGIGTHVAIDEGLVGPGGTLVSTDSHANILGAIGAFGQGMGDQDIAHAFAHGTTWFVVPQSVKVALTGMPSERATAKDVTLALTRHFGANGLLGLAAEMYGDYVDQLGLAGRVTLASMATEMGGIIMLFPPNEAVLHHCEVARRRFLGRPGAPQESDLPPITPVHADDDASYADHVVIDIDGLEPLISRPGHPEDVVPVDELQGTAVDSVFIGSCTNGRYEDFAAAARVLEGRHVAPGVVLKIVPATDVIWRQLLEDGVVQVFKEAGALISNAGCAGCAAGQVGQNGPGEVTVSTGNRNFPRQAGQGRGLPRIAGDGGGVRRGRRHHDDARDAGHVHHACGCRCGRRRSARPRRAACRTRGERGECSERGRCNERGRCSERECGRRSRHARRRRGGGREADDGARARMAHRGGQHRHGHDLPQPLPDHHGHEADGPVHVRQPGGVGRFRDEGAAG
jgi:3-isopropylmalate/(R)-2-methylmalate dehydratase large subunit